MIYRRSVKIQISIIIVNVRLHQLTLRVILIHGDFGILEVRYGVDVINSARMNVENMHSNNNQSIAINWRWRKEGDVTMMPRAMYNTGFNWLGSDRYLEDASYLRMSYLQASYSVDPKELKKYGLNQLYISASANNLFFLTKYTGLERE